MPKPNQIVINTGPIIALVAALGDLDVLSFLYQRVWVPLEVADEILANNAEKFAAKEFAAASWLEKMDSPLTITRKFVGFGRSFGHLTCFEQKGLNRLY